MCQCSFIISVFPWSKWLFIDTYQPRYRVDGSEGDAETLRQYGESVDDGYEWHFEGECPIIAAYDYDEPCDVVILAVRVDKDGKLTIIGDEKNDRGNEHEIDVDEIFAGHLSFVTSEIRA